MAKTKRTPTLGCRKNGMGHNSEGSKGRRDLFK